MLTIPSASTAANIARAVIIPPLVGITGVAP
jgi:hypothetical protein